MSTLTSVNSVSKIEVATMLFNLKRAEINAREDLRNRLAAIEQKLLFASEEREGSFPIVIFTNGINDIPVCKVAALSAQRSVFFSREQETFFVEKEDGSKSSSLFDFSNLERFHDVPEIREACLRDPEFHKAIFGA
jgi:hypothetical protein